MKAEDFERIQKMLDKSEADIAAKVKSLLDNQRNAGLNRKDDQVLKELHQTVRRIDATVSKLRPAK